MHVLIFTGQFGMGHIGRAQAVQEEILRQEPTASVTVLDIVEDCFPQCTDWSTAVLILPSTTALASIICSIEWRAVTAVPDEANDGSKIGPTAV